MVTFKKKEIIYRPYEPYLKLAVDLVMVVCAAYLIITWFFGNMRATGHSMNNTIKEDDVVLINTVAYNINKPERYDLIAFTLENEDDSTQYIKRVIGLPGETVQIMDGKIYIDGHVLTDDVIEGDIYNAGLAADPIKLEYNEYFVLGDNRNNSEDSRFSSVGLVKTDHILGKPWLIVYPFKDFGTTKVDRITTEEETTEAE